MNVETITREECNRLRKHQYAGTRASLDDPWRKDWTGTHWAMRMTPKGTALVPVNVK